jgi:hypothetical protein
MLSVPPLELGDNSYSVPSCMAPRRLWTKHISLGIERQAGGGKLSVAFARRTECVDDGLGPAAATSRGKFEHRTGLVRPAKLRGSVEISLTVHHHTGEG